MIRIMLCCASGMSTSLLVEKMKKAALEQGIEAEIWAVGANEVKANANRTDIILLGPQVRYAQRKIESEAPGVPVAHIDMKDYGMMNGQSVLKQALAILEKINNEVETKALLFLLSKFLLFIFFNFMHTV